MLQYQVELKTGLDCPNTSNYLCWYLC